LQQVGLDQVAGDDLIADECVHLADGHRLQRFERILGRQHLNVGIVGLKELVDRVTVFDGDRSPGEIVHRFDVRAVRLGKDDIVHFDERSGEIEELLSVFRPVETWGEVDSAVPQTLEM